MSDPSKPPKPYSRKLRGYAFDPSLSLKLDTSDFNTLTYSVPWEDDLKAGPTGEYLEIVDYDPTVKNAKGEFGVFYDGVDLNDPYILAANGLAPSDSNPKFHQQMVYAVAMKTIKNFEKALGRKIIWRENSWGEIEESYVEKLRIYPHALREPNAFYSPAKRALLFGYFRSTPAEKQNHMPNSWVFTCLSHDIIAHEVTHAILDGLHLYYNEPTNPDVLAFHEAFADIVALFQHFTMPEVLKNQIARTKGNLESQNLLGQLAQEFGSAVGGYGSLRDAIGKFDDDGNWVRIEPDPSEYETVLEPHKRGSILVAAVFDAFLVIYKNRVADLIRIATGGSGILPDGELHPDLVNRLAKEAAKSARHILSMCIRAIDYCPPVDITFGEYLRAIITADYDLVSNDNNHYRLAFIDAFKRRGIYPKGIKTLSVETLRYPELSAKDGSEELMNNICDLLVAYGKEMQFTSKRKDIFVKTRNYITSGNRGEGLHSKIYNTCIMDPYFEKLTGIMTNSAFLNHGINKSFAYEEAKGPVPTFKITNLRVIKRVGPTGKRVRHIKFSLVQTARLDPEKMDEKNRAKEDGAPHIRFRGGTSFIFDLDKLVLKYSIRKPIFDRKDHKLLDEKRLRAQYDYAYDPDMNGMSEMEKYFDLNRHNLLQEPFALLHNH